MNVKSLEDVYRVEMFGQIVPFETFFALPDRWGLDQMFEIGIVKALLCAKRYLSLDLLKKTLTVEIMIVE